MPKRAAPPPQQVVVSLGKVEWTITERNGRKIRTWKHTPPTKEEAERIFWRPIYCGGFDLSETGEKLYHHFECKPCTCIPGPHYWALTCDAYEIGAGGQRGSGKSADLLQWLSKGDPNSPNSQIHASYLNHPQYKFLVLRKNAVDLSDFFEKAKAFFKVFGGVPSEKPMRIDFPSGAFGIFDHLSTEDAYEKYQGREFTRVSLEEAEHIPREMDYLNVLMSCRSPVKDLREQAFVTFNPGGAGRKWIRTRFIHVKHPDGKPVKRYDWTGAGHIYTEPGSGKTRAFIFFRVEDNPYSMRKGYDKTLEMLARSSTTQYERWRHGNFDIEIGQFFEAFREEPKPGEPPEARHIIPAGSVNLAPYYPRAIGMDWGYAHESAVIWGCWHPKQQLHIYRELVVRRMNIEELGASIARLSLPDLEKLPSHSMSLYLSHDCFNRDNFAPNEAELLAQGINSVLGRDAAFVYGANLDEELLEPGERMARIEQRKREMQGKTMLTIIQAPRADTAKWQTIRELLRWWPINPSLEADEDLAIEILQKKGTLAYHEYKDSFNRAAEVLPKILFWDTCPRVVESIQAAVENPDKTESVLKQDGDDPLDALGHLTSCFRYREDEAPADYRLQERVKNLREQFPNISTNALIYAGEQFRYEEQQKTAGGYLRIPRAAGPTRRTWMKGRVN